MGAPAHTGHSTCHLTIAQPARPTRIADYQPFFASSSARGEAASFWPGWQSRFAKSFDSFKPSDVRPFEFQQSN
jgi:hypothetical protein